MLNTVPVTSVLTVLMFGLFLYPQSSIAGSDLDQSKRLVVVELFTSQGCSSCPPADKFLTDLMARDDVLPLSLHVDYWDYIGWKDPFASPLFTNRQRQYASVMALRYVYTPQMVIQGVYQAVGSRRSEVLEMIEQAKAIVQVPISLSRKNGDIRFSLGARKLSSSVIRGFTSIVVPASANPAKLVVATVFDAFTLVKGTSVTEANVPVALSLTRMRGEEATLARL